MNSVIISGINPVADKYTCLKLFAECSKGSKLLK